jgi:hypothetical protein
MLLGLTVSCLSAMAGAGQSIEALGTGRRTFAARTFPMAAN